MKQTLSIQKLIATCLMFSFYVSCAPKKSNELSNINLAEASAIFGGQDSTINFQKESGIVGLVIFIESILNGESTSICTGTLIDPQIVMTAAHCVTTGKNSRISRIAVVFINDMNKITKADVIFASVIAPHEDFLKDVNSDIENDPTTWNDIALIKLKSPALPGFKLAKLAQPKTNNLNNNGNIPNTLMLAGYGIATPIVNKEVIDPTTGETEVVPAEDLENSSGVLRQVSGITVTSVTADQKEILLQQSMAKGACHGDSGGPAFFKQRNQLVQVGITSRGTNKIGNCHEGAIYTNVIGHLDWIKTTAAKLLATKP